MVIRVARCEISCQQNNEGYILSEYHVSNYLRLAPNDFPLLTLLAYWWTIVRMEPQQTIMDRQSI